MKLDRWKGMENPALEEEEKITTGG
jgi:hypothetical protein